ncbi:MAG: class I SAM-dependent methyltransferase, partial [Solirubrobacteraceae bacterium]
RARAKAADAGIEADFEIGDAMLPPWPPATFDVVLARHVVWALPEPALTAAARRSRRCSTPGSGAVRLPMSDTCS